MAKLSDILRERGYVYQHSSETLEEITDGSKRTVYLGIDPSADSLHLGNLMGLIVLRRFIEDGHRVIIVTGGGTGMIGDPGGKSEERNLLDAETIERNATAVAAQIRTIFGGTDFIEENNATWLGELKLIDFLREVGKHFTVNAMIKKEMIRDRIEKENPISFTEFSYSLLQGYDYLYLNEKHGCDVQVGGSDQWGNILAGVEYIRRAKDATVYALTWPLIVNRSTGKKFGKSEQGALWLDKGKTSPYQLYQFLLNVDDEMVEELLLKLTLVTTEKAREIVAVHADNPATRFGQRRLAWEVAALVHGEDSANQVERISDALFGDIALEGLSESDRGELLAAAPSHAVQPGMAIVDLLVEAKLASSKREARQFLSDGAITLNGEAILAENRELEDGDFIKGIALLKRGRRHVVVLTQ